MCQAQSGSSSRHNLHRARPILGTGDLLTLYHSLFLPILSHCCEIWGITYISTIHCIEILQKRVIILISGVNRQCHKNILFSRCTVLKFKDLVDLKVLIVYLRYSIVCQYLTISSAKSPFTFFSIPMPICTKLNLSKY